MNTLHILPLPHVYVCFWPGAPSRKSSAFNPGRRLIPVRVHGERANWASLEHKNPAFQAGLSKSGPLAQLSLSPGLASDAVSWMGCEGLTMSAERYYW